MLHFSGQWWIKIENNDLLQKTWGMIMRGSVRAGLQISSMIEKTVANFCYPCSSFMWHCEEKRFWIQVQGKRYSNDYKCAGVFCFVRCRTWTRLRKCPIARKPALHCLRYIDRYRYVFRFFEKEWNSKNFKEHVILIVLGLLWYSRSFYHLWFVQSHR